MYHRPWLYKPNKNKAMIFIVGQNPGRSRVKDKKAFVGNRTADYVMMLLKYFKLENVYLTNACNNDKMDVYWMREGRLNLQVDISIMKPKAIVSLGNVAHKQVEKLKIKNIHHYKLMHPSMFLRFNLKGERDVFEEFFEYLKVKQDELSNEASVSRNKIR